MISEDETVFAPYYDAPNKSCSRNHFGLSDVLEYALFLVHDYNYRELGFVSVYTKLSFDSFQKYLDNAILVLNDMRYYDGDRLIENNYGLEVYNNPKNYSVVNFRELMPLDDKQFRRSYNLDCIMVENNSFVTLSTIFVSDSKLKGLSFREYEVFFGEGALKALGIFSENVKKKLNT